MAASPSCQRLTQFCCCPVLPFSRLFNCLGNVSLLDFLPIKLGSDLKCKFVEFVLHARQRYFFEKYASLNGKGNEAISGLKPCLLAQVLGNNQLPFMAHFYQFYGHKPHLRE